MEELYKKIKEAEEEVKEGKIHNARDVFNELRKQYGRRNYLNEI